MAKILVLGGAGAEGSVLARDLVNSGVEEVVLGDYNIDAASELADELNGLGKSKVSAIQIDANQQQELVRLLKEQKPNLVCNIIGPFFKYGPPIARAAIEARTPYIDINDDYQPALEILDNLYDDAKQAGIPVFTGCGVSPGWTNLMSKLGSSKLDQTDEILIEWLWPALAGGGAGVISHIYHMLSGKCLQFLDGEYQEIPAGTGKTKLTSTDGKYDDYVYYVGHGEPATLPRYIENVRKVINKGGLIPSEATDLYFSFIKAGLDGDPVEIDGEQISLAKVTMAIMERKLKDSAPAKDVNGYFKVTVIGKQNGQDKELVYEFAEHGAHMTTWTTSVMAQMIINGEIDQKGAFAPEALEPEQIEKVIKGLEDRGLTVKRTE